MKKTITAIATAAIAAGGVLIGIAAPAQAAEAPLNGTWWQSVGRPSADAPCPPEDFGLPPWQTSYKGQREWAPSWAQWPNDGEGGYVCNRVIVWAEASKPAAAPAPAPSPTPAPGYPVGWCEGAGATFYQFGGGWMLDSVTTATPLPVYPDGTCTGGSVSGLYEILVYAPAGYSAEALCEEASGSSGLSGVIGGGVFRCQGFV